MNLVLATALALAAPVAGRLAVPPGLPSFAEQLSFLGEGKHAEGGQPDYCYPMYTKPNYDCYRNGYPKCCSKSKGNCPVNKSSECECPGTCSGGGNEEDKSKRCSRGDGTCKGELFCQTQEGACDGEGRCQDMTISCDRSYKEVCGCNGVTYENECAAFGRGVSVDYEGACGSPVEVACTYYGAKDDTCASGDFCSIDLGACKSKIAMQDGTCMAKPAACAYNYAPVCGCDSETYDNECQANAEGVNVMHERACDSPVEVACTYYGVKDDTCASGDFCSIDLGACKSKVAMQDGTCLAKPGACASIYAPVCGCNSRTYDNECQANAKGVNVMHSGAC